MMKLTSWLDAGAHVSRSGRVFQGPGIAIALIGSCEVVQGALCQAVQPGLKSESFRLFLAIAQGSGNGFIDYFFLRKAVAGDGFLGFTEVNFPFHKTLEARQIDVYVGANVIRRNRGWKHGG